MRICLISREYPPDSGWGGIASYTYQHAHALKELGHDVEVVSLAAQNAETDGVITVVDNGLKVHRIAAKETLRNLPMMSASTPFTHFVLQSILSLSKAFVKIQLEKPFDVAEVPEHLSEGLCPALTKILPLVVRLHTPQSKFIAERYHNLSPSFDQEFVAMVERVAMLSADVITSPSEDMADYVAGDLGYPRKQIQIIRNPVNTDKFQPEGPKALTSAQIVLFVGRLEERKGVHYLIKAAPKVLAACPSAKFILVGADTNNAVGQKSTLQELQQMVSEAGIGNSVQFIAHVPLAQMPDYYRSASVCVVPSLYDNAPCTLLEAMSSGKASVVSTAGGSKEYIIDGESGILVAPKDADGLAEAIKGLLLDQSNCELMGGNARKRIMDKFHPTTLAKETVEIYKLAIEKYGIRTDHAAYSRPPEQFLKDTENLLVSYDRMLYDFLYTKSWNFRLAHRLHKLTVKLFGGAKI